MPRHNPFSPALMVLLTRRIPHFRQLDPHTKYIVLGEELRAFKQELLAKWGTQSAYIRDWVRRNYGRKIDYENHLAQVRGFKNMAEYVDSRYRLRGFDNRTEWQRFSRHCKRHGLHREDAQVLRNWRNNP